uniref:ribosomal protein L20 n=1 Tax=Anarthria humilis TaxID=198286 RepID=UPI001F139977|nr:ribosomal protein L20 [Anarthria humilis]YP_010290387.1 ribosomal protein L20 [Anarthria humilis]ULQ64110.1 ribosomal protein L20 [Anarthria humilis]ULQ64154.1 ribosomal protein L20 [Anarthria humilis]
MTRGGSKARRRRKKIPSTFKGARSRCIRIMTQQKTRASASSHRDRGRQKRDFRRLWITRINAVTREDLVFYSYNQLIHNLYKKQLLLNRKMLAQIIISTKKCLSTISKKIDHQIKYTGMLETEFPGE